MKHGWLSERAGQRGRALQVPSAPAALLIHLRVAVRPARKLAMRQAKALEELTDDICITTRPKMRVETVPRSGGEGGRLVLVGGEKACVHEATNS